MTDQAPPSPTTQGTDAARPDLRASVARIDSILRRQRGRIRSRFLLHGLGLVVAGVALVLLGYFAADRFLRIPSAIRILVSISLLVWLGFAVRRRLLYPLGRKFETRDVALAIERSFPSLHQRVVSALQLRRGLENPDSLRDQSPAMVAELVNEASDALESIPVDQVVQSRSAMRTAGAGLFGVLALASVAAMEPEALSVFAQRIFGSAVDYPRATTLVVELPESSSDYQIERSGRTATITMAAGGDLPILVVATGEIPREVELFVESEGGFESTVGMAPRPGAQDRFRHVFRRVRNGFSFHAQGGDDPTGDLDVTVRTIEPPLVANVEAVVTPPAYTMREPEFRRGGAIEGLTGSEVRLAVGTTTAVTRAVVEFLDTGRELELTPVGVTDGDDEIGPGERFEGVFPLLDNDRYVVRLTNAENMTNPRPGTYPIVALRDFEPVGRLLAPDPGDVLVALPAAKIPVRFEARDDFGLARVEVSTGMDRSDSRLAEVLYDGETFDGQPVRDQVFVTVVDLASLATVGPAPVAGDTIDLVGRLVDRRDPDPQAVDLTGRRIHVVDEAELSRRLANVFRRVRDDVERALNDQQTRREALADEIANPSDPADGRPARVVALQVGQVRIATQLERIHDGLMRAFDLHLFNDLEGPESRAASRAQDLYVEIQRSSDERRPRLPEFYRELRAARADGRVGPMEQVLDPILEMVGTADRLANSEAQAAATAIEEAAVAGSRSTLVDRLNVAASTQDSMIQGLASLLDRLDEWNEIQDVVQQVRSIRDAQRDIEARTRSAVEGR
ncbi:MAG: hypothetical protein AAF196_07280 [Planctomycetota bacterium]